MTTCAQSVRHSAYSFDYNNYSGSDVVIIEVCMV